MQLAVSKYSTKCSRKNKYLVKDNISGYSAHVYRRLINNSVRRKKCLMIAGKRGKEINIFGTLGNQIHDPAGPIELTFFVGKHISSLIYPHHLMRELPFYFS